ncbi:MAG: ATP12 family protein, partial [Acetobacter orientalis]
MNESVKQPVATPAGRKRFWKHAEVVPTENGYAVQLDGRPIKLPERTPLCVPS